VPGESHAAPRILFVCVENSCRSQMAEGFARSMAQGAAEVHSAGSRPSGEVNPRTQALMAERGVDLSGHASTGLAGLPEGRGWDCIVTMGCGDSCPSVPASRREDWELPDPARLDDDGFRRVRDEIEQRVRGLLERCGLAGVTR
jgi:protein-tyrosine-phosphatase